ncbi:hypothetical protein NTCA1_22920 [Novosphingobium sp. TCA1]|nr:hypothetical protein NTCA1_22920 [Novosphingobium sp. TCA1]
MFAIGTIDDAGNGIELRDIAQDGDHLGQALGQTCPDLLGSDRADNPVARIESRLGDGETETRIGTGYEKSVSRHDLAPTGWIYALSNATIAPTRKRQFL